MSEANKVSFLEAKRKWDECFSEDMFNSLAQDCVSVEGVLARAAIRVADTFTTVIVAQNGVGQHTRRGDDEEGTTIVDSTLFSIPSPRDPSMAQDEILSPFIDSASVVTPRLSRFAKAKRSMEKLDESP